MNPESPFAIANYFIGKAWSENKPITPMQVLKLVYIAHGWHLALTNGKPLISEPVQAWKYGPVIESLYHALKVYGSDSVTRYISTGFEVSPGSSVARFLDSVWRQYSKFTGGQLSNLTHQTGTPWSIVWNENGGDKTRGAIIPDKTISEHYEAKLKQLTP